MDEVGRVEIAQFGASRGFDVHPEFTRNDHKDRGERRAAKPPRKRWNYATSGQTGPSAGGERDVTCRFGVLEPDL
jgi:hypothetical protein